MNPFLRASGALAATAAVVSLACVAVSQTPPGPAPGGPPSAEQRAEWMQARQAAHAKALHDILNLRPDQEGAFQAFQAAIVPSPHRDRHGPGGHDLSALTTPQRLDAMADRLARREAEFHRRADAIKSFYAVLSPEQQRAFDAMPMMMGHGRRGMDHGPSGRGPDGPPQPQG